MIREFVVSSAMGKPILAYRSSMGGAQTVVSDVVFGVPGPRAHRANMAISMDAPDTATGEWTGNG